MLPLELIQFPLLRIDFRLRMILVPESFDLGGHIDFVLQLHGRTPDQLFIKPAQPVLELHRRLALVELFTGQTGVIALSDLLDKHTVHFLIVSHLQTLIVIEQAELLLQVLLWVALVPRLCGLLFVFEVRLADLVRVHAIRRQVFNDNVRVKLALVLCAQGIDVLVLLNDLRDAFIRRQGFYVVPLNPFRLSLFRGVLESLSPLVGIYHVMRVHMADHAH